MSKHESSSNEQLSVSQAMENGEEDNYLYPSQILKEVDWSLGKATFKNGVSPANPGENLILRPLRSSDYDQGYMQILQELTSIGEVSKSTFLKQFNAMKECPGTYYITVLEDTTTSQVIGTTSLIIEKKFIHSAGTRGRIEDVVVKSEYRGKQLGKLLVEVGSVLGKHLGCYKMSLECKEENTKFYEGLGFKVDNQYFMIQRYKD